MQRGTRPVLLVIAATLTFVGVLNAPWLRAQSPSPVDGAGRPAFEVAIIKPNVGGGGVTGGCRGIDSRPVADTLAVPLGRCVITAARLSHLMSIAFGVPIQRITGFPDWDGPHRFDVQAEAENPAATTEQQLLSMLQRFLTERFGLTVHREVKDGPTFSLVVAKNGPKNLHPSTEAGKSMMPQGTKLVFKGYSMQELATFFSVLPTVQRPVQDMTAINGRYDFSLEVLQPSKTQNVDELKGALLGLDTIFSDVQEQLGLRFEPSRAPIENLVIDHAEQPTPD
jgi:uncharacterized protein (TIGR03435 family)